MQVNLEELRNFYAAIYSAILMVQVGAIEELDVRGLLGSEKETRVTTDQGMIEISRSERFDDAGTERIVLAFRRDGSSDPELAVLVGFNEKGHITDASMIDSPTKRAIAAARDLRFVFGLDISCRTLSKNHDMEHVGGREAYSFICRKNVLLSAGRARNALANLEDWISEMGLRGATDARKAEVIECIQSRPRTAPRYVEQNVEFAGSFVMRHGAQMSTAMLNDLEEFEAGLKSTMAWEVGKAAQRIIRPMQGNGNGRAMIGEGEYQVTLREGSSNVLEYLANGSGWSVEIEESAGKLTSVVLTPKGRPVIAMKRPNAIATGLENDPSQLGAIYGIHEAANKMAYGFAEAEGPSGDENSVRMTSVLGGSSSALEM